MSELDADVKHTAERAVEMSGSMAAGSLDYSANSIEVVDAMVEELGQWTDQMAPEQIDTLVQDLGCYVLEVGRREFGGRYLWNDERDQPVLVVGEPDFRVAMMTWDKVRRRFDDPADSIAFHFHGFAERVGTATPGIDVLFV